MTSANQSSNGKQQTSDHLLHNLILFAGVLRGLGLDVGSGNVLDLVRATEYVPIGRKQDFYQAARCLLVHRKQDLALFDEAFQVFWRKPASGQSTRDLRSMGEDRRFRKPQLVPPRGADASAEAGDDRQGQASHSVDLTRTYSAREVLRAKDFANYSAEEIVDARRMLAELSWDLGSRRTRRWVPGRGPRLDLRKTFRLNLKYGGEPLELAHRRQRDKTAPSGAYLRR